MKGNFSAIALLLVVIWPMILVVATLLRSSQATAMRFAPWAALPALVLAILAPPKVTLNLPWMLLGTELNLVADIDRLFLFLTALLWWTAGMFAGRYLPDRPRKALFFSYFLGSMAGNLGLVVAHDVISFYAFFALMSFSAYGLVLHERSTMAVHAGRVYIALVVLGEVALFAAIALAIGAVGDTSFDAVRSGLVGSEFRDLIILLLLIGFGIKVGVIGLHGWLPLAHPVAPTPASAVLSGVMIKAGLLGWLRILPLGEVALMGWGKTFIILGLAASFYGAAIGLVQRDLKTLLAYSSVSQMGIPTAAIGLALMVPGALPAISGFIALFVINHGLSKAALFLGVGLLKTGHSVHRHWIRMAMWLPALSLAGAPFTGGMASKVLFKEQAVHAPDSWAIVLKTSLPLSALATALLMARFMYMITRPTRPGTSHDAPIGIIWPWAFLVATLVLSFWWASEDIPTLWTASAIADSFWPVSLAAILALVAIFSMQHKEKWMLSARTTGMFSPRVPPGDIFVPISHGVASFLRFGRYVAGERLPKSYRTLQGSLTRLVAIANWRHRARRIEESLNQWPVALLSLLLLGIVIVWAGLSS